MIFEKFRSLKRQVLTGFLTAFLLTSPSKPMAIEYTNNDALNVPLIIIGSAVVGAGLVIAAGSGDGHCHHRRHHHSGSCYSDWYSDDWSNNYSDRHSYNNSGDDDIIIVNKNTSSHTVFQPVVTLPNQQIISGPIIYPGETSEPMIVNAEEGKYLISLQILSHEGQSSQPLSTVTVTKAKTGLTDTFVENTPSNANTGGQVFIEFTVQKADEAASL